MIAMFGVGIVFVENWMIVFGFVFFDRIRIDGSFVVFDFISDMCSAVM
jgi:hypothetical protein